MRLWVITLVFLIGCLPIPQVYLEPHVEPLNFRLPPAQIQTDYVTLSGYPEPSTPEIYNQTFYLRYFNPSDQVETILVLMSGIFGGATSLDIVARQMVAAIPNLEVWAVDRRANALEDRKAFISSLQQKNPQIAYDYYISRAGTPEGFNPVPPENLRFMGEWGLEVHLYDLHVVVRQARDQAARVILGGHSLGASIASYYAAHQFPEGPGYIFLDGLVLIDGVLGRTGGFSREPEGLSLGPIELIPGTEGLRQNQGSPYLTFGLSPDFYANRGVAALLAHLEPEGLSPGDWVKFPATNQAVLGILHDDQYGVSTVFSSSLGKVTGATFGGNLPAVIISGSEGIYSQTVTGVAAGFERVDWDSTDAISDIREVSRSWVTSVTDRNEWYFPVRLAIDLGQYNVNLEDVPGFIPNRLVSTPTLAVGAGRGLVTSLERFSAYSNSRIGSAFSAYVIPGFTHQDIVQAENNPLVFFFERWLEQL